MVKLLKNVSKEVYEEVGIKVKISSTLDLSLALSQFHDDRIYRYLDGEIKVDGNEIEQADWFSKEEVKGMYKNQ